MIQFGKLLVKELVL